MKKVLFGLFFCMLMADGFAQPKAISYQAIVRNPAGAILPDQAVTVRFSILADEATGTLVYREVHQGQTNTYGLLSLQIGKGTSDYGLFSAIDWGNHQFFCKVEIDISGGSNFVETGTFQFLSVPYSLYSENAGHASMATAKNSYQVFRQYATDLVDGDTIYMDTRWVLLSPKKVTYWMQLNYTWLGDCSGGFPTGYTLYLTGTWYNSNGAPNGASIWGSSATENNIGVNYLQNLALTFNFSNLTLGSYGDYIGEIALQCPGSTGPFCKHQYFMLVNDHGIIISPHVQNCSGVVSVNSVNVFLQAE